MIENRGPCICQSADLELKDRLKKHQDCSRYAIRFDL